MFRVAAGTAVEGSGSVRFKGSPELVRWITWVLTHVDMGTIPDSPYCPLRGKRSLDVRDSAVRVEAQLTASFPGHS
ncbi:hypothetical protein BGM09_09215 [Streptomyces sp. CBMA29]|nr:hypothetical protein [Streptomyces sp. CBMA29]